MTRTFASEHWPTWHHPLSICIDMDGVLADINTPWLDYLNKEFDENLTREDIKDWSIHQFCKNATPKEVYRWLSQHCDFGTLEPIKDAIHGMEMLRAQGHQLTIVTACQYGHTGKRHWLKTHLPWLDLKSQLIFAHDKQRVTGDILLDDSPGNIKSWTLTGRRGVIFDQPWNWKSDLKATRVLDWTDFILFINGLYPKGFPKGLPDIEVSKV